MVAAKEVEARGGTIIRARGSSNIGVDKKYGWIITPEKEILMILNSIASLIISSTIPTFIYEFKIFFVAVINIFIFFCSI